MTQLKLTRIKAEARGLPEAILNRPKTGFTLPVRAWLRKVGALSG